MSYFIALSDLNFVKFCKSCGPKLKARLITCYKDFYFLYGFINCEFNSINEIMWQDDNDCNPIGRHNYLLG